METKTDILKINYKGILIFLLFQILKFNDLAKKKL